MPSKTTNMLLSLAFASLALGCEDDLSVFNEIDRLRVLGVQAEPPDLVRGERTTLRALVVDPDGRDLDYSWSWCPLTAGRDEGFACAVDEAEFQAAWERAGGEGPVSFDLGEGEEASFVNDFDPVVLRALCSAVFAERLPIDVPAPSCERSIDITVRLTVRAGDDSVVTVKQVPLLFEAGASRNQNPMPAGVDVLDGDGEPRADDVALEIDKLHPLRARVERDQSEAFEPAPEPGLDDTGERPETLILTWFVSEGETEFQRTTFIDGEVPFEELLVNEWDLPADLEAEAARLWLVLRDERGGIGWIEREFPLKGAER